VQSRPVFPSLKIERYVVSADIPNAGEFRNFLGGLRVLEIGDELGEYCGKVLAGLGADVVRVEPPGGAASRSYGPFYHDEPHRDRSLYFWHYNLGKRSVVLDVDSSGGRDELRRVLGSVDIVVDSTPRCHLAERGLDYDTIQLTNPRLVWARITPFGDDGPWADYQGSDLDPAGFYETPPIAPQMWQSYHMAGELTAISVLGALNFRLESGAGQYISTSVHEVVSNNTESDTPDWIFLKVPHSRHTCRHSLPRYQSMSAIAITKDGRWMFPYRTYAGTKGVTLDGWTAGVELLKDYGMQADLEDPRYDTEYRYSTEAADRLGGLTDKLIGSLLYDRDVWRQAQKHGLPWAPIRRPEENCDDEHWKMRDSFFEVYHDELDQSFVYSGAKWVTEGMAWPRDKRPPLVGEHTDEVLAEWINPPERHARVHVSERVQQPPLLSAAGKPFALSDVRIIDLTWMRASAAAPRFLAAMGAEVIKVEHESRLDGMRFAGVGACPLGGRAERDQATGPIPWPVMNNPNRGGDFMEINSGKLGISLNLKSAEGRAILENLIRDADMVVEGYSPGTMTRMGLGYEQLKALNPSIIYVQQSGLGELGTYGRARTYGPTAQALTGISDMSGLPEPFPPAGIGYSYLDWFGAYNMALAMLAALYRRNATGDGCHIDASQGDTGLYLTGTSILDYSVNGRSWKRYGNRSPYKPAAPHGAYRTRGEDRWIAIAAFTEQHWQALIDVFQSPMLAEDGRFATLRDRLENQDALDAAVDRATRVLDGFELMAELQRRGVPAGVCQTAQDRYDNDPQLKHLQWLVELDQTEIGRWPVKAHPVKMSATPAYVGGRLNRSGPNYGEDNEYVLGGILKISKGDIQRLRQSGVL